MSDTLSSAMRSLQRSSLLSQPSQSPMGLWQLSTTGDRYRDWIPKGDLSFEIYRPGMPMSMRTFTLLMTKQSMHKAMATLLRTDQGQDV